MDNDTLKAIREKMKHLHSKSIIENQSIVPPAELAPSEERPDPGKVIDFQEACARLRRRKRPPQA